MRSLWLKTVDEKHLKFLITNPDVWVVKGYPPIMPKMSLTEKKELACDALDSTRAVLVKLGLFKQIASSIESHMMNKAPLNLTLPTRGFTRSRKRGSSFSPHALRDSF
jgi:hypothetical protein